MEYNTRVARALEGTELTIEMSALLVPVAEKLFFKRGFHSGANTRSARNKL